MEEATETYQKVEQKRKARTKRQDQNLPKGQLPKIIGDPEREKKQRSGDQLSWFAWDSRSFKAKSWSWGMPQIQGKPGLQITLTRRETNAQLCLCHDISK